MMSDFFQQEENPVLLECNASDNFAHPMSSSSTTLSSPPTENPPRIHYFLPLNLNRLVTMVMALFNLKPGS